MSCLSTQLIHIDVHTGLGPESWDTLLLNDKRERQLVSTIFGEEHLSPLRDTSIAYVCTGDFNSIACQLLSGDDTTSGVLHIVCVINVCVSI